MQNTNLDGVETLSREELQELRDTLLRDADAIKETIEYRKETQGENIDRKWLFAAEKARRLKLRAVNTINDRIGNMRRAEEALRASSVEAHFVAVAKRQLPQETFSDILEKALRHVDAIGWEVNT